MGNNTSLKSTIKEMDTTISLIMEDLTDTKNKAACARVRKNTLAFEKIAKQYRKDSVAFHKKK